MAFPTLQEISLLKNLRLNQDQRQGFYMDQKGQG